MYKILRYLALVFGASVGIMFGFGLKEIFDFQIKGAFLILGYGLFAIIFGFVFYFLFPIITKKGTKILDNLLKKSHKTPTSEIIVTVIGLIIGLLIAFLISLPLSNINFPIVGGLLSAIISVFVYVICGLLGMKIARDKKEDILKFKFSSKDKANKKNIVFPKILDTSVIIDGRIYDILKTGFLEGPIIIPMFMVKELQYIADSEDANRRQRGRRGLDILDKIQEFGDIEVKVIDKDYSDINEVDHKLLKLTEDLQGKLITNDYNLNKVAQVQKISILNINELALSLKPVVIQGEKLVVDVLSKGKEPEQGLAYLSDGTMVVVEDGRDYIGQQIETTVTSILQTPAGKMIFVRKKMK